MTLMHKKTSVESGLSLAPLVLSSASAVYSQIVERQKVLKKICVKGLA